jgi:1-deoxy-D-xylulose-5-phosphate synthase
VKPLDEALVLDLARSHEAFVTLEDNAIAGGAGSAVGELLAAHGAEIPLLQLGLPDRFLEHATREQLLAESGLDVAGIRRAILARFPQYSRAALRGAG